MAPPSRQPGIEEHGAIGDGRSVALISLDGTIDWLCWPRFDSPSIFASLLDASRGGSFELIPAETAQVSRRYIPYTNVLQTNFRCQSGELLLTDLMTLDSEYPGSLTPEHELLREARCTTGRVEVRVRFDPRPNYGSSNARIEKAGRSAWRVRMGGRALLLQAAVDGPGSHDPSQQPGGAALLSEHEDGGIGARVSLLAGQRLVLSLAWAESAPAVLPPVKGDVSARIARAVAWWQAWSSSRSYEGPYRAEVIRSALVLKLLAFSPSGAVVAAPTTSLPERFGGDLNWDYRFCWLRDAALTIRALYGLGSLQEARSFVSWLLHATRMHLPQVRVLYDVYGRRPKAERELAHLEGWRRARPVRVGNAAADQLQLDVFGEVIDAVVRFVEAESAALDRETRHMLTTMGEWVCRNWERPDAGIWEPRDIQRRHTHSAVMCWVTLDGLLRLHDKGVLPGIPGDMFRKNRTLLREAVESLGFDTKLGTYTQAFGDKELDAALLRLPALGYVPADSPRMKKTVKALQEGLGAGNGLIYRYSRSMKDREGAFVVCSFWLADALALGAGTLEEARDAFEKSLGHASDLGLFAEEVDPKTGAALGNFPQAYSHVGLINAALSIAQREATEARGRTGRPKTRPTEAEVRE